MQYIGMQAIASFALCLNNHMAGTDASYEFRQYISVRSTLIMVVLHVVTTILHNRATLSQRLMSPYLTCLVLHISWVVVMYQCSIV